MIFGGFPKDTCRGDIEGALRVYVEGYEGVARVGALGKYGSSGRVEFVTNTKMWIFIKANAGGKKFDFEAKANSIFGFPSKRRSANAWWQRDQDT